MAQIILQTPDKYVQRIQNAFQKRHRKPVREAIIDFVKETVRQAELDDAIGIVEQNLIVEKDIVE